MSETDMPPAHGEHTKPVEYSEAKLEQRRELAAAIRNHKTVLELFAGEGHISEVYAGLGKRHVLVDDDEEALAKARDRVEGVEVFVSKNEKWMDEHLGEYDDITLVDFDPYGNPADTIKHFFSLYEIHAPLAVAITDGTGTNLKPWFYHRMWEKYEVDRETHFRERIPTLLTSLMRDLGKKHGFTVDAVNGVWGGSGKNSNQVYYCGYLVKPKGASDAVKMKRKIGFDRAILEDQVLEENDDFLLMPAVIAREIVHPYGGGKGYKPADELEKATWTADGRWLTTEKHPDTQLLIRRSDVKGRVESPRFVKNLVDPKTKRPMDRGIKADLRFFKNKISPLLLEELKSGARRDVSIGFTYDEDPTPGEWRDQPYDFVQRNIFIDHVLAGIPRGRCPTPYCGIGVDELKIGLDPYRSVEELPETVKVLPREAQEVFLKVVNEALEEYEDEGKAFATAWAAVKAKWEKVDGEWVKKKERDHVSEKIRGKGTPKTVRERFMEHFDVTEAQVDLLLEILGENVYDLLPVRGSGLDKEESEREKLHEQAEARAKKYGIAFKDREACPDNPGHLTPPKDYPSDEGKYGDPVNFRYPLDTEQHIRAAWAYCSKEENMVKGCYMAAEWKKIHDKVEKTMTNLGAELAEDKKREVDALIKESRALIDRVDQLIVT